MVMTRSSSLTKVSNLIAKINSEILATTHYLEEAENCNRMGFMVAG